VAIDEALRLEGITADVRARILIRLKRDLAPWLEQTQAREPFQLEDHPSWAGLK
jgi:hypothetical protein